jgi:hypothetical protein
MRGKLGFAAFALALGLVTVPAAAQFVEDDCSIACTFQSDCNTPCQDNGQWMTCGFQGICNSDPDADGVHWNDNCPYHYNPNQANCDGDSQGDVCDAEDSNYQQVTQNQPCYIVDRGHFGYRDQRLFEEAYFVDQSSCGKPAQWRNVRETVKNCYWSPWGPPNNPIDCCDHLWSPPYAISVCTLVGNNQCHF